MIKKVAVIIVLFFLLTPFLVRAPIDLDESPAYSGFDIILWHAQKWYVNNPVVAYNKVSSVVSVKYKYLSGRWKIFVSESDLRSRNDLAVSVALGIEVSLIILFISWINPIYWLRLFFLKWFKSSKRIGEGSWGVVYNSLNKLPIDLATVRLIQVPSGQVIQTKVTDRQGRFIFIVNPGDYKIEVSKQNFLFPSQLFFSIQQDGHKSDLYHGNIIKVSDKNGVIAVNIPVDPSGEYAKPISYWVQSVSDNFRFIISWFSFLLALLIYIFFPQLVFLILFEIQGLLFLLLGLLASSKKSKRWGKVYDIETKKPIKGVEVTLFNAQFNKHIISQITDQHGCYYFVVGEGDYYLTFKRSGFVEGRLDVPSCGSDSTKECMIDKGLEKTLYRHPGGLGKIKEQK